MAEVLPLKLVDLGSGQGALEEFDTGDQLPKSLLPALAAADISGLGTAALRDAIGAGDVFARGGILGTVSQSGGVPTGAIIERGSNANGEYVRFADGTQIFHRTIESFSTSTTASGSVFAGSEVPFDFPVSYVIAPQVFGSVRSLSPSWVNARPTSISAGVGRVFSTASIGDAVIVDFYGIGRWY